MNLEVITEKRQTKLTEWLVFRQSCLDELLRHDGRGSFLGQDLCFSCGVVEGTYKCKDCFMGCLLRCRDCMVEAHRDHPLHRAEVSLHSYLLLVSFELEP
jgi:hypothetical protein